MALIKKEAKAVEEDSRQLSSEELAMINTYTNRKLSADELYVFTLTLCDNDVDRDGERFTVESLFSLEKLFVGKTGILDHNPTAKNQTARIYWCGVESIEGKKTSTGDDYFRLKAKAYMPMCEGNRDTILAIESGILKEISVGCAVEKTVCSVCGEPIGLCAHKKGESYGSRLCVGELVNPTDAYEWSFVAVPAQREAGVIKKSFGKENDMTEILKSIEQKSELRLSKRECEKLDGYILELKQAAADGVYYRESLTAEVLRLSATVQPEVSRETMECLTKKMSVAQLKEFKSAYEKRKSETLMPSQLYSEKKRSENSECNDNFRI